MGELKQVAEQSESVIERVKAANRQLALAGLGLASKLEAEGKSLYARLEDERSKRVEQYVKAGEAQRGEKAVETPRYVLAGLGALLVAREESEKLFNELVAEGEKRSAA